jgi:hypothetical protein
VSLNHHGNVELVALACPLARQCTAVSAHGLAVTFDPLAPGAPRPAVIDQRARMEGVSCPSATQCTAVDGQGWEDTFNPVRPRILTTARIATASTPLAIACPSTRECSVVGTGGIEVAFSPAAPRRARTAKLDAFNGSRNVLTAVSCPSVHLCVATHIAGLEITYDPANPGKPEPLGVAPRRLLSISCSSVSACAIGGSSAAVTPLDPSLPSPQPAYLVESPGPGPLGNDGQLVGIACPVATQCTVVDNSGHEITLDPWNPGYQEEAAPRTTIDSHPLTGLACPSTTQCTAVDAQGYEVTFDPA